MISSELAQYENPERGVFLLTNVDANCLSNLTPTIIGHRVRSNEPITLYINSNGGDTNVAERFLRLVRSPRQDGEKCMLTTVCVGIAASAAADMLSSGDYAIAYSDSAILFHGTRKRHAEVTVEDLQVVGESLREENEYFAMKLASQMFRRLATQALLIEAYKTTPPNINVTAVAAVPSQILALIRERISSEHKVLIDAAIDRMMKIQNLVEYVERKRAEEGETASVAQGEDALSSDVHLLKLIVDFEVAAAKEKGVENPEGISDDRITLIREDFLQLKDFLSGEYYGQAIEFSRWRGHFFLANDEMEEWNKIAHESDEKRQYLVDKCANRIFPLWYIVVSLCRLLQSGEHWFSARDAWWLGLVDEVPGSSLPSIREWREWRARDTESAS